MLISVGIAIQAVLLGLALFTAILRCWTRLYYERKKLTLSEYFACIGWIFALGWFITSTVSMLILVHHPPAGPDLLIPSVDYQKDALCMAEMATAVVVVCLPGLKKLIMRSRTPTNTTSQGFSSKQSGSGQSSNMTGSKSRTASQAYAEWGVMDDEIELATHPQQSHLPGELQDVGKLL
ncbi:hypothetical protein BFJ69_g7606 [Fusarium oxysporum]|uniref:Integral membrane protein n=1 Tax=Fusarium oxysporum TaxID=5507 RepID=A0A420N5S2_FUSOX|nr:hypothetical protein BFJ69_g7606 [Fusarium oxysporum]